jgi:NAD(P)H dehydrogenase (quinone)
MLRGKEPPMKHALIVAHPDLESLNLTLAKAYGAAAAEIGDKVAFRDLYRLDFDPRLSSLEIPKGRPPQPAVDVTRERALIGDADVFAFVYPLWFNAQPAMLKGYIDRVFGLGFGYGAPGGGAEPLLRGRSMISITTSGAPTHWVEESGAWSAVRKLFDEHFAAVCGLAVIDHLHFGGISPNMTPEAVQDCVRRVSETVKRRFGPPQAD